MNEGFEFHNFRHAVKLMILELTLVQIIHLIKKHQPPPFCVVFYCIGANKLSYQLLKFQVHELLSSGHVDRGKVHRNSEIRCCGKKSQYYKMQFLVSWPYNIWSSNSALNVQVKLRPLKKNVSILSYKPEYKATPYFSNEKIRNKFFDKIQYFI